MWFVCDGICAKNLFLTCRASKQTSSRRGNEGTTRLAPNHVVWGKEKRSKQYCWSFIVSSSLLLLNCREIVSERDRNCKARGTGKCLLEYFFLYKLLNNWIDFIKLEGWENERKSKYLQKKYIHKQMNNLNVIEKALTSLCLNTNMQDNLKQTNKTNNVLYRIY